MSTDFLFPPHFLSSPPEAILHITVQYQERTKIKRKTDQGQSLRGPVYDVSGPPDEALGSRICDFNDAKLKGVIPEYVIRHQWLNVAQLQQGQCYGVYMQQ